VVARTNRFSIFFMGVNLWLQFSHIHTNRERFARFPQLIDRVDGRLALWQRSHRGRVISGQRSSATERSIWAPLLNADGKAASVCLMIEAFEPNGHASGGALHLGFA
jgi:hypothetical protein